MNLLLHLLSPGILGTIAVFLAILWMLKDESDKTRPLLVFALVLNLFYGYLLTVLLGREDGLLPWKYDYALNALDRAAGFPSSAIAIRLQGALHIPLYVIYQLMVPMMIVWFLVTGSRQLRKALVLAYVSEMVVGPVLYAILPACGPLYAFKDQWLNPPLAAPPIAAHLVRFSGMPNAFPSLHVATAFVFVLFALGRPWRIVSLFFLLATILATLSTGEHYTVDLIPGLAFGAFAVGAGEKRFSRAALCLAVVLTWSISIRFAYPTLIAHALLLRAGAVLTLALTTWTLAIKWRTPPPVQPSSAPTPKPPTTPQSPLLSSP